MNEHKHISDEQWQRTVELSMVFTNMWFNALAKNKNIKMYSDLNTDSFIQAFTLHCIRVIEQLGVDVEIKHACIQYFVRAIEATTKEFLLYNNRGNN